MQLDRFDNTYFTRKDKIIDLVKDINPLLINKKNLGTLGIADPCTIKYEKYTKIVDELKCPVPILKSLKRKKTLNEPQPRKYTKRTKPLFKCNNIIYYGVKDEVYGSILLLNYITSITRKCDVLPSSLSSELIELSGDVPEYVMNQYIDTVYTNSFDLSSIKPEDYIRTLKFIDRYPTTVLSIDTLESQIVDRFSDYVINNNDELLFFNDIAKRYMLKNLCLILRNKIIIDQE